MNRSPGRSAVERAAREAAGRLVSALARRSGDVGLAEDALSAAIEAALEQWEDQVPEDPESWLFAVARRRLLDAWRRDDVRQRKARAIEHLQGLEQSARDGVPWPDERLPLLFVCAHPAIAPESRAPLMLQSVLGLTADEIGPLMGVSGKTIGQRLWRARTKIREANVPFVVPEGQERGERLGAVLDAIYGMYGSGWVDVRQAPRAGDARWLARIVAELLPHEPEAWGLVALLAYVDARRETGRRGGYVPLDAQDPRDWDAGSIHEGDEALLRARAAGRPGAFQLEAAIQSALVHGRLRGAVDREAVLTLYEGLVALAPTLGARVGRAAALAESRGAEAGLAALDAIGPAAATFQPWWAVRAELCAQLGRADAEEAYAQAVALCDDPDVRAFLLERRVLKRS